ncbi:MAG: hypothetical protein K8R31_00035 [Bacteroidales bacterium]|nr:hypothetical protein [Bacteroidales bacterium]
MIINIPDKGSYENLGIECLTKAFEMLFQIGNSFNELAEYNSAVEEEVNKDEIWDYHQITVRASLILLYQGVEYLMKNEISKHSSLLLIENNKKDWPTLPERKDKDFDEMLTISGENLLTVFCAISDKKFNLKVFVELFDNLRIKRNKLVHGLGKKVIDHKYILEKILQFFTIFYEKESWIVFLSRMFVNEPTFGYSDWDAEVALFYRVLDFTERELGKSKLNKHLKVDLKARRYYCPECNTTLNKLGLGQNSKWTFLSPNKPDSTKVRCLICREEFKVIRKDCTDCSGNVLNSDVYKGLCLSCLDEFFE